MSNITSHGHVLGWVRDLPDHRDYLYSAPGPIVTALPSSVDLRSQMPAVYDQGPCGSCVSNAIGANIQFIRLKNNQTPDFIPSRLYQYYLQRSIERTIPLDNGAMIRTGIKVVGTNGAPDETLWPYIPTPADPATNLFPPGSPPVTNPPASAYSAAWHHKAITYYRVTQELNQLRGCLAEGYPIVFGFTVFSNIYDSNGQPVVNLNMPSTTDQMLGGHAVMCVGYNPDAFIIRNSWGDQVQDQGYFYMSYAYMMTALASDFWTIRFASM